LKRRTPQWLKLKKSYIKHVTSVLSGVPTAVPEIEISPYPGGPFDVLTDEADECFVPLVVGAEGFYADYDAETGELLEVSHQRVARRVKARGMWSHEVYTTGGDFVGGQFRLDRYGPTYYRKTGAGTVGFNEFGDGSTFPRHLRALDEVHWLDDNRGAGPGSEVAAVAGLRTVRIGELVAECLQVVSLRLYPSDEEEEEIGDLPRPVWLEARYIAREGRTVLLRRFCTPEHMRLLARHGIGKEDEWPGTRSKITYNGTEFFHWFDLVTDIGLVRVSL